MTRNVNAIRLLGMPAVQPYVSTMKNAVPMFTGSSTRIWAVTSAVQLYMLLSDSRTSYTLRMVIQGTWVIADSGTEKRVDMNTAWDQIQMLSRGNDARSGLRRTKSRFCEPCCEVLDL